MIYDFPIPPDEWFPYIAHQKKWNREMKELLLPTNSKQALDDCFVDDTGVSGRELAHQFLNQSFNPNSPSKYAGWGKEEN